MNICPAILTDNLDFFKEKLRLFQIFTCIDIDLIIPGALTNDKATIDIEDIFKEIERYPTKKYRIHIMCDKPFEEIQKVSSKLNLLEVSFIIHQESEFDLTQVVRSDFPLGVAIKHNSQLKSLEFYNHFFLVQIMSVEIGKQGGDFKNESLEKVKELRKLGYDREVSLDGSINLETLPNILNYEVNSLSVGSFFSKSLDLIEDKKRLERVVELHIKSK